MKRRPLNGSAGVAVLPLSGRYQGPKIAGPRKPGRFWASA